MLSIEAITKGILYSRLLINPNHVYLFIANWWMTVVVQWSFSMIRLLFLSKRG